MIGLLSLSRLRNSASDCDTATQALAALSWNDKRASTARNAAICSKHQQTVSWHISRLLHMHRITWELLLGMFCTPGMAGSASRALAISRPYHTAFALRLH